MKKYLLSADAEQLKIEKKMYKVCVYTICKNESKNIPRWVSCLQNADLIYVLDTGSTDNSVELLRSFGVKVDVFVQSEDFDFSVARNASLFGAKKWCVGEDWIFVTLDLDEFIEPTGIQKLKYWWKPHYDTHILFERFADETGLITFRAHKAHSAGDWVWENKVHEVPRLRGVAEKDVTMGMGTNILYDHVQDFTKVRPYLEMLKQVDSCTPDDVTNLYTTMWQAHDSQHLDISVAASNKLLEIFANGTHPDKFTNQMVGNIWISKIVCYYEQHMFDEALKACDDYRAWYKSIEDAPARSEHGVRAKMLFLKGQYRECIRELLPVINANSLWEQLADIEPWNDNIEVYMLLAQAYSELQDYTNAQHYAKKSTELDERKRTK